MMKSFSILVIFAITISMCSCMNYAKNSAEDRLWYGITHGNVEIVEDAISSGCNLDSFSNRNYCERTSRGKVTSNPVMVAMIRGEFEIAKKLIDSGADVNKKVDRQGRTILHYSVEYSTDITKKLILFGADINIKDKTSKTPLYYSLKKTGGKPFPKTFYVLLEHGAEYTEKDVEDVLNNIDYVQFGVVREMLLRKDCKNINEALKAAFLGESDLLKDNSKNINNIELLQCVAAAFCDTSALEFLLDANADYDKILMSAVLYNNKDTVEYILSNYIENAKNLSSKELTYCLIKSGDISILKMLNEKGVSFSVQDIVLGAIQYNQPEILEHFIKQGLDVNFETGVGSPLVIAIKNKCDNIIDMLLEYGANINGNGKTGIPLIIACEEGYVDVAEKLINAGADVNIVYENSNKEHITPLIASVYSGNYSCVLILIKNGADTQYRTNKGETANDIAKSLGMTKIHKALSS